MRRGGLLVVSFSLSGCLLTPGNNTQMDLSQPFIVSGVVPNKSVPVVVMCEPDDIAPSPIRIRIMPSQTPILDKNNKAVYSFSGQVQLPLLCIFRSRFDIPPAQGESNGGEGIERWAHLIYAQELTRANGTKYLSYQNAVTASSEAKSCALNFYTQKGTWASVANNCSKLIDWNHNGEQYLQGWFELRRAPIN